MSFDMRAKTEKENARPPQGQLKSGGATRERERESRMGGMAGGHGRQQSAGFLYSRANPERCREHESRRRLLDEIYCFWNVENLRRQLIWIITTQAPGFAFRDPHQSSWRRARAQLRLDDTLWWLELRCPCSSSPSSAAFFCCTAAPTTATGTVYPPSYPPTRPPTH